MRQILAIVAAACLLWTLPAQADDQGSAIGGKAGSNSGLAGGLYQASPPVLTNGQQAGFAIDPITHAIVTTPASGATGQTVAPTNATSTDISGTITLGGTYQTAAAASATRKNCSIQNPSTATEALLVKIGTMAQPYSLGAGAGISTNNGVVNATDVITVTATTNGHAFAGTCQ